MGETPKTNPELESHEAEINKFLDEIALAAGNALPVEDFEKRQKTIEAVAKKMIAGKQLTEDEFKILSQESFPNEVSFPDIQTLVEVFSKMGLEENLIKEIAEHEKSHFDSAKERGLSAQPIIKFYRKKDNSIQFLPAVKVGFVAGGGSTADNIKRVASSPQELSPSDKDIISE